MLNNLPSLERLIRQLQKVPYLASKNVYRVATHFLESDLVNIEQFCAILLNAKNNLINCNKCFSWHEKNGSCAICSNKSRDNSTICVVETWHDLMAIERAGGYNGFYHVLGGALCPLEGIGIEDLRIDQLVQRTKSDSNIKEIIFATNPTPEGEATASFIATKLKDMNLAISRLASGVPIGSNLEFMDKMTIYKALSGRRPF